MRNQHDRNRRAASSSVSHWDSATLALEYGCVGARGESASRSGVALEAYSMQVPVPAKYPTPRLTNSRNIAWLCLTRTSFSGESRYTPGVAIQARCNAASGLKRAISSQGGFSTE